METDCAGVRLLGGNYRPCIHSEVIGMSNSDDFCKGCKTLHRSTGNLQRTVSESVLSRTPKATTHSRQLSYAATRSFSVAREREMVDLRVRDLQKHSYEREEHARLATSHGPREGEELVSDDRASQSSSHRSSWISVFNSRSSCSSDRPSGEDASSMYESHSRSHSCMSSELEGSAHSRAVSFSELCCISKLVLSTDTSRDQALLPISQKYQCQVACAMIVLVNSDH